MTKPTLSPFAQAAAEAAVARGERVQVAAYNPVREGERELRAPDPVTGLNLAGGRGEMSPRQWRRYCKKFRQPFHGHGNK